MKVLHLVGSVDDTGGILSFIRDLQETTKGKGWDHVVLVNQAYRESRTPALRYRFSRGFVAESPNPLTLLRSGLVAWRELRQIESNGRFDVLHAHSRGGLVCAMATARFDRRPVLFTSQARGRRAWLYRVAASWPRLHMVLLARDMVRHYGLTERWPKVSVISNSCGEAFFEHPLRPRHSWPTPNGRLRLIGVGNVVRWKQWDLVLRALALLPAGAKQQVEFSLWGPTLDTHPDSGRFTQELRDFVHSHGLEGQVRFRGATTDVLACLQSADWLVHPTTNEPLGIVIIEALALGIPAIVSQSGGPAEMVIPGQTGLYFEPNSAESLAARILGVLRGEVTMWSPGEIRESVRPRSATAVANAYCRLYQEIARGSAKR